MRQVFAWFGDNKGKRCHLLSPGSLVFCSYVSVATAMSKVIDLTINSDKESCDDWEGNSAFERGGLDDGSDNGKVHGGSPSDLSELDETSDNDEYVSVFDLRSAFSLHFTS